MELYSGDILFTLIIVLLSSALVTEVIGIHALFGAFLMGCIMPKGTQFVRQLAEKIEAREVKLTIIGTIAVPMMVLVATAFAIGTKWGAPSIFNSGPQGFSETLYAYVSQTNNNGIATP